VKHWSELTLGDIGRNANRYRPFLSVIVALVLVVAFLPGNSDDGAQLDAAAGGTDTEVAAGGAEVSTTVAGDASGAGDGSGGQGATTGGTRGGTATGASGGPLAVPKGVGPDCDPATGRIRVPAFSAPPCVAAFSGDNGGATAQGVNKTTITVVMYQPQVDPATDAALTAAGASNTPDEQLATMKDYVDYFNAHYETYGRKVVIVNKRGSGEADDDAAAKADAVDIATRVKPFAVFGGTAGNAFVTEIASRKILCICTTSQPQELYEKYHPYVGYSSLMGSTQGYIHRAEYIGKRLAGRNAKHAGSIPLQQTRRAFGLLYFETPDNAYKSGVDFFGQELRKYGVSLKVSLAYTGPPNLATTQEQARPFIQRMVDEGVTSIIFSGDPISPAIFTQEATRQNYFPEWIITGSALTDTTVFGRTYDPAQWRHAFGVSFLTARAPEDQTDAHVLHRWHHGRDAVAANQYGVIYPIPWAFFTGVHLAGPELTVASWYKGITSYPVTNKGKLTYVTTSVGNHGLWPFADYLLFDDVTEVWWDTTAQGPDELDNQGVGMYRYVDGGRRYLPGGHPGSDPKAFDTAGSVTLYNERPAQDGKPPTYEHKHYH
jgi:hypothetical protein